MAAVFALCFLNILLFLWNPTFIVTLVNGGVWQWRAVDCVRLFEMFVVGSWTIAVNLDGISLLTQCSLLPVSLYFLQTVHVERHLSSLCLVALMHAVFEANGGNELTRSFFLESSYDECSYDSIVTSAVPSFLHEVVSECTFRLYSSAHLKAGYHNTHFWYKQLNAKFYLVTVWTV